MDGVPEHVKKQVEVFQEWATKHPNFPKNIENKMILRFLHSCYYDMEKAKTAAELFFKIRSNSPELFTDRDPLSPHMKKAFGIVNVAQYGISGKRQLFIWQLNDPGLEKFDYIMDVKVFTLCTDSFFLEDFDLEEGDLVIMDVKDVTLKMITKFNLSAAKKLSKYQEEALPIRLKQIHVINAPPIIDKVFGLMRPFLKQELIDLIHFHAPNSETLYEYINKDDLPADYGGKMKKMEEQTKIVMDRIHASRHLLIQNNLWRIDKKSKNKTDASEEISSFRTLAID